MWLIFAAISILFYALADIFSKKTFDSGSVLSTLEMFASAYFPMFILGLVIYFLNLGESGKAPWQLIFENPLILLANLLFFLYWVLFLFSMNFVGLSIIEAIQGAYGVFFFVGLVLVNLVFGKLDGVSKMLNPIRLVPIILVLLFTFLLPNTEKISIKVKEKQNCQTKSNKAKMIIGIIIVLFATAVDSLESLATTVVLDERNIGIIDFISASYFAFILPFAVLWVYISIKNKRVFIPFSKNKKYPVFYTLFAGASSILYIIASQFDAVRTSLIFIAYPIVPIFGAKLFLKEKYTLKQNICIWTITLSAIVFCVFDGFLVNLEFFNQ